MIPSGLANFKPEYAVIKEIIIDSLFIEAYKIDIKELKNLREHMVVLLSKCKDENATGGCNVEQYLTLAEYENAYCGEVSDEQIKEAEWFYVLSPYPCDKEKRDILFQAFATNSNPNLLKYPVQNPFDDHSNNS